MNDRYRMVTEQDGGEHVSSVLLAPEEIDQHIAQEMALHRSAGWDTRRYGQTLRCQKGDKVRWIWVRNRTAMEDTL